MQRFRWICHEPLPAHWDLRQRGWMLVESDDAAPFPTLLSDPAQARSITARRQRAQAILIGIDDSRERAEWLREGFGEVLPVQVSLGELEMRAMRVRLAAEAEPRRRRHGALELDLLLREGTVGGRRLGLHPREFSLLWRLAQTPGHSVAPQDLLSEVWQMSFKPETNSLAVHVCRLRAKLASAGLGGIVSTAPDGGYALSPARDGPDPLRRRLAEGGDALQSGAVPSFRKSLHET
ncbi:winged helix-turn-helix domain-containing protein [Novosphingobium sp.]|uniref:winged helix-turn-helix transcriptional regulator n=1 Tax=Novosphingobium sp. TaxID=1874826 RepID=UPI00286DD768|nr:winged helix-turn-helix domain-containing protein [Novosphingobium sp.]